MLQILTLYHIIDEVKEHNISAIPTFVDFKKAFDSINRNKMFDMLFVYGIPSQIIEGSKECILIPMAQVVIKDCNTNFFLSSHCWSSTG